MDSTRFSLGTLIVHFEKLQSEINELQTVRTDTFLLAYRELTKLFDLLGKAMAFVKGDVVSKVTLLEELHSKETDKMETLQTMIDFEVAQNIHITSEKRSGSRTLLRLVRALEFVQMLLDKLSNTSSELTLCARQAYDSSLANYHSYWIRKTVSVALYTLPYRKDFIAQLQYEENTVEGLRKLSTFIQSVHQNVQTSFTIRNLQNLP